MFSCGGVVACECLAVEDQQFGEAAVVMVSYYQVILSIDDATTPLLLLLLLSHQLLYVLPPALFLALHPLTCSTHAAPQLRSTLLEEDFL